MADAFGQDGVVIQYGDPLSFAVCTHGNSLDHKAGMTQIFTLEPAQPLRRAAPGRFDVLTRPN